MRESKANFKSARVDEMFDNIIHDPKYLDVERASIFAHTVTSGHKVTEDQMKKIIKYIPIFAKFAYARTLGAN